MAVGLLAAPLAAQDASRLELLMEELAQAQDAASAKRIERQVQGEWAKSGSATFDLLLKRGRDALEVEDYAAAIEHLTALTDHAPDFAEGWQQLALAYFKTDRLGPAVGALEHTLALVPDHFGALRGLGAIFEQLDKPALAYEAYSRVLSLRPFDPVATEALDRLDRRVNGTTL